MTLPLGFEKMRDAFYGKVVQKVGDRRYLEDWSKDVSDIAHMYIRRIGDLIESNQGVKLAFDNFLNSLHHNINDSINQEDAIEMLAQHLITEPIFDALFGEYSFVKNNVVSKSLNDVITTFKVFGFEKEQEKLKPFYDSIKLRASGIDNAAGKQKLIVTLYDKFFSTGFKDTTEQLGIVFTPVEVVDFINHSVDATLQKYFGIHLADQGVHILDPFTGTGTFITRTLQYLKQQMDDGQITFDDILRKYLHELHANEIVLLSYYIAAINIEAVFDEVNGPDRGYQPFEGIVLTDTFESTERQNSFMDELLGQNNKRLKKQQEQPITAIISNPPYSAKQKNQNDDNSNIHYPLLENRIKATYVKESTTNNSSATYDSYIKAIRWSSDRLAEKGILAFVTNGSYIDSNSANGVRKSLYKEFNHLYIFNLRGDQRTSKERSRKEGGKIFGSGSRAPIAICVLIKDGSNDHEIFYHDIGDYLSRQEKLDIIQDFNNVSTIPWTKVIPDANGDWINKRDPQYRTYTPIAGKNGAFNENAIGSGTYRDVWVSGFSQSKVLLNSKKLIQNYNLEVHKNGGKGNISTMRDSTRIKWTAALDNKFKRGDEIKYHPNKLIQEMYRPFTKKWLMYDKNLVERPGKYLKKWGKENIAIVTTGKSSKKGFSAFIVDLIPDRNLMAGGAQGFMRYINPSDSQSIDLLITKHSNINSTFAKELGLSEDDTFAYIYGLLNSIEYQTQYQNDLVKDLAHIPIVKNKEKYVEIGQKLINLHLHYEEAVPYEDLNIQINKPNYHVEQMTFSKIKNKDGKRIKDKSTIIFNKDIIISGIPKEAYQYIVNGNSAIEWIMDQYQIHKTDKEHREAKIIDDPNDFSDDPKYIFNLLLRIITVSLKTIDLINQLPKFEVKDD